MKKEKIELHYDIYNDIRELDESDRDLLNKARETTGNAYAPYSNFRVAAVAKLSNGEFVSGTNQENASFSAGICAERVLLATASTLFPNIPVEAMAISYQNNRKASNQPVTPCGICRQALQEFEGRLNHPIRLILAGMEGKIFVFESASTLLPLAFTSENLKN